MKHSVSFSVGKDSSAMLIRMIEEERHIDDIVFINVMATPEIGAEFPEMYEYIGKMEEYIHRKITVVSSVMSFDEAFHRKYQSGKRAGSIYGFPLTIGAWCNSRLKLRAIQRHYKSYGPHIRYIGLAADEPERIEKLQSFCRAPLAEWGMTESDCMEYLRERNMVNPLYQKFRRLGCWFCVKQNLDSLRILRRDYPKYWRMLLDWDQESPWTFRPNATVRDLEERFSKEEADNKKRLEEKSNGKHQII